MDTYLSTLLGLFILHLQLHSVSAGELLVLEGESVTLNVTGHEQDKKDLKRMSWSFYEQEIVVYSHKNSDVDYDRVYEARVEFDVSTFSLKLKNLQKSDSGLYKAEKALHGKQKETVAEYMIYVLEHAAAPTLTVVSNWSSSDSCNVTLNCTGLNVSLISRCNGIVCSQEGGVTSLSISLNHNTVSCNHSNPVSWRQTTMEFKPLCPLYREHQIDINRGTTEKTEKTIGVILGIIGIGVVIISIGVICRKRKIRDHNIPSDNPDQRQNLQMCDVPQSGVVESPGLTDNTYDEPVSQTKGNTAPPITIYDTVQLPAPTSPAEAHQTPACPETIYAVVKKKENSA
ncbi:CD48 antigen-like isoform X2 [Alosa pseudoharengus]|uniref:CD48 antigen-like isoform X2 n=1 Tax=Alosa pseudoharengus TaxID=34774 RepID=UPI003F8CCFB1